jgi:phage-related protein
VTSPGGRPVARVTVRVLPDSSGFDEQLRRELADLPDAKIDVGFELDREELRRELATLANEKVEIPVDLDDRDFQNALARVSAARDAGTVIIPVELDDKDFQNALTRVMASRDAGAVHVPVEVDTAAATAHLDAWLRLQSTKTIDIDVDVDADPAQAALAGGVNGLVAQAFASLAKLKGLVGESAEEFKKLGSSIVSAYGPALQFSGAALALSVGGAGITAAWGAAATAIAILPGLLVGAGAAAGVMALGMDGIKKAAESIKPSLDALKKSTSEIFEKGLTPVFKDLGASLTSLKPQIDGIANGFVALAKGLTETVTSSSGMDNIRAMATGVADSLKGMRQGLSDIVAGFLEIGAQASVWQLVTDAVNHFGETWRTAVTATIADGTFDRAVNGLSGTIQALEDAFIGLVTNGLRLFAGAAPGVNSFLTSLTNFFGRFDWESLGQSVGKVFDGLGKALDKVPQSTITAIQDAFKRMGDLFQDPQFQAGLTSLIELLPKLIDGITSMARPFADLAGAIEPVITALQKADDFFKLVDGWITKAADWTNRLFGGDGVQQGLIGGFELPELPSLPGGGGGSIDVTANITFDAAALTADVKKAVTDGFTNDTPPKVAFDAATLTSDIKTALAAGFADPVNLVVTFNGGQGFNLTTAINTMMADAYAAIDAGFQLIATIAVPAGMQAIQNAITTGAQMINLVWTTAFTGWQAAFTQAFNTIATVAIPAGLALITQALTQGLIALNTVWTTALTNWNVVLQGAFLGMQQTVLTNMTLLQQVVTNGMLLVQQAFLLGWQQTQVAVTNAMLLIQQAVTNGMLLIQTTVTQQMLLIQQAFANGWLLVQNAVLVAMTQVQAVVTNGLLLIVNNVNLYMGLAVAAFQTQWLAASTATSVAMLQIQTVVTAGMAAISSAVTNGMTNAVNAMQVGWQQGATSAQTGMAQIVAAVTAGMAQIQASVAAGMASAVAAMVSGWAQIAAAAVSGMAQMVAAATSGMAQFLGAVTAGAALVVSFVTGIPGRILSALGNLASLLVSAGRALMQGLLEGIKAAAQAVYDFVSGIAGKIASLKGPRSYDLKVLIPNGQWLMSGLQTGLENGMDDVRSTVSSFTKEFADLAFKAPDTQMTWTDSLSSDMDQLIAKARELQDAYSGIGDGARIPAGITASVSIGPQGISASVGARPPVQITNNYYTESSVSDAEVTVKAQRKQAALGLFGG